MAWRPRAHPQQTFVMLPDSRTVVSLHCAAPEWHAHVIAALRADVGGVRRRPVAHLVCVMLDAVFEGYFSALEAVGDALDRVEGQVLRDAEERGGNRREREHPRVVLRRITKIRHDLAVLRKQVWPLRECLTRLAVAREGLLDAEARMRVRETLDRAMQVLDVLECYRDVGHAVLDLHLAAQNNRMQEVMQTLAVVTTIFVPLSFLAGIEGMNFSNQPELYGEWSYVLFWVVVAAILAGQIIFFRRKGWI